MFASYLRIADLCKSVLKSLVIPTIWLALRSVIYSRITSFFVQNPICSKSRHFCSKPHHFSSIVISVSKTKWDLKAFLFPLFNKQATRSIKFGTDWILRFQNGCSKVVIEFRFLQFWFEIILVIPIELALCARPVLISRVWFRTKLHSTQFNYRYVFCIISFFLKR